MDPFLARTMVETLSKGIDPLTGRVLGQRDSCAKEEIQEALQEVLMHCTIESVEQYILRVQDDKASARKARAAKNAQRYPRGGEPWSHKEEQELLSMLRRGKNLYQIASVLKRTPRAIAERMKNLQCVPIERGKATESTQKE